MCHHHSSMHQHLEPASQLSGVQPCSISKQLGRAAAAAAAASAALRSAHRKLSPVVREMTVSTDISYTTFGSGICLFQLPMPAPGPSLCCSGLGAVNATSASKIQGSTSSIVPQARWTASNPDGAHTLQRVLPARV